MSDVTNPDPTGADDADLRSAYCSNCGYTLDNLTESSKCPECGLPIVDVLVREKHMFGPAGHSKRYQSEAKLFGLPVLSIAMGPDEFGRAGTAKGIIAIGDRAIGGIALGGASVGVVAAGGIGIGVCGMGGMGVGALVALGGGAVGTGLSVGGGTIGAVATGGGAIGYIAQGGGAAGVYANGGGVYGKYVISPQRSDPQAVQMFDSLHWLLGRGIGSPSSMYQPLAVGFSVTLFVAAVIGLAALWGHKRHESRKSDPFSHRESF